MDYPVVAEIWTTFEATLMVQAKRLVEDIASHQGRDSKELWSQIKKQVRIPLFDTELNEPTLCPYSIGAEGTAVAKRCRAPCLLGFATCSAHANRVKTEANRSLEEVDSIKDVDGITYYLDKKGIARDSLGKSKGVVKEGVLYLFEGLS